MRYKNTSQAEFDELMDSLEQFAIIIFYRYFRKSKKDAKRFWIFNYSIIQLAQRMGKAKKCAKRSWKINYSTIQNSVILPFNYSIYAKDGKGEKERKEILEIQPFYHSQFSYSTIQPFNYSFPQSFIPSILTPLPSLKHHHLLPYFISLLNL